MDRGIGKNAGGKKMEYRGNRDRKLAKIEETDCTKAKRDGRKTKNETYKGRQ